MKINATLSLAMVILFITGAFMACEPEVDNTIGPTLTLNKIEGFITKDTALQKNIVFKVSVTATAGTHSLDFFQINEQDTLMDVYRLISGADTIPTMLSQEDSTSFTKEFEISVQEEGTSKYTFFVADKSGLTDGKSFHIFDVYTALDSTAEGLKMYNSVDTSVYGSLDLKNLEVVKSSDPSGDIEDAGIDPDLPESSNWKQRIRPKNDATLYFPLSEVNYDEINSKEDLINILENFKIVNISQTLEIGDVYMASTDSEEGNTTDYYILRIENIVVSPENDEDYYVFSLKQGLNL